MSKKYVFVILIFMILEIFVFNFQALKSLILDYNEINMEFTTKYYDELKITKIDIDDINEKINNVYVDYNKIKTGSCEDTVIIEYTDESFSGFIRFPGDERNLSHEVCLNYDRSKYIQCDFIGKTKDLNLYIESDGPVQVNDVTINKKIPFKFNFVRFIILSAIVCFSYSLLKRDFFKQEFDINNKKQFLTILSAAFIFILILSIIECCLSDADIWNNWLNRAYSIEFVNSLKEGKVNIEIEKETLEILKQLNNPYDISEFSKYDMNECFDVAYYNENVYLYYGILPVLILLLPINLLTGGYLSVSYGTLIFLVIGSVFTVKLVGEIIYRYFKRIPLSLVILFSIFMLFNNKLLCLMSRPYVYEFVIAAGYCFVMAGISIFLEYLRTQKKIYLLISCILMALAVACRPPTLFISIIIFTKLLYDSIQKIKSKQTKEIIPLLLLSIIPYLIVGMLLMIYNYIRFENIFEFGANYQVSVTDFRNFGTNINRILIGLTTYFISPVNFIPDFPFITSMNWMPEYNGYYFSIAIGGGYFATSLIGMIILFAPYLLKKIKKSNKEMFSFIVISLVLGLVIAIFESNKCGSIGRYMVDFIWLFNIVTILLILFIYNRLKIEEHRKKLVKTLVIIILISCIINTLMIYSYENRLLKSAENINIYYFMKYMMCFWL